MYDDVCVLIYLQYVTMHHHVHVSHDMNVMYVPGMCITCVLHVLICMCISCGCAGVATRAFANHFFSRLRFVGLRSPNKNK